MKSVRERFKHIERVGLEKDFFQDFYHQILTISWPKFFLIYFLFFLVFNAFFGFLYWLDHAGISGTQESFFKNFAFSVQTFSTVGYGVFAPSTAYAHVLVITESMLAVIASALLTGLTFAKFARPTARVQFTEKVVITQHNGKPTMMFRIANLRGNQIAEANIKAVVLRNEVSLEGHRMRVQKDVQFIRHTSSFFVLTWTVMHVIDETSPLWDLSPAEFISENLEMSVSVIGHDETFSQTVHSSCTYSPEDFVWDKRFADMFVSKNNVPVMIDYTKFNELK